MPNEYLRYFAIAVAAASVTSAAIFAMSDNRDVAIKFSPKGDLSFNTTRGQSLTELIGEGLDATVSNPADSPEQAQQRAAARRELAAFMTTRGFYQIDEGALIPALRKLDKESDTAREIRQILYDLDGPFARPLTLRDADGRFWDAFEDLHKGLREDPKGDSTFFAELYARLLDENSILGSLNNQITAEVQLVNDGSALPNFYSCPGSDIKKGTFVTIRADAKFGGWIDGEIDQSVRFHPCMATVSRFEFLSGKTISLGANAAAFDQIFPQQEPAMTEFWSGRSGPAKIVVYPGQLAPRELLTMLR